MGDAWPNTKTQHVQCMTSDEEIPLENERTHFREQINHRFFFFFLHFDMLFVLQFRFGKGLNCSQCDCSLTSDICLELPHYQTCQSFGKENQRLTSEMCFFFFFAH